MIMNLASVTPAGAGFVTAWPSGENRPTTSNLNFVSGRNVANLAVVPVGADGKACCIAAPVVRSPGRRVRRWLLS